MDGRKGLPSEAPFDVIHVGGAIEKIPIELLD
jgi:protein-L-isoaspartate O-methyltransferase